MQFSNSKAASVKVAIAYLIFSVRPQFDAFAVITEDQDDEDAGESLDGHIVCVLEMLGPESVGTPLVA